VIRLERALSHSKLGVLPTNRRVTLQLQRTALVATVLYRGDAKRCTAIYCTSWAATICSNRAYCESNHQMRQYTM
jgi:hypothetical protein